MIPPAPLSPTPRDTRLDLLRGWLQLSIFASHAHGSFIGAWLIHAAWGLSDSSEQFVLLSGFGLGSVFALKLARSPAAGADLLRRALRLWQRHLLVFLGFAALVLAVEMFVPLADRHLLPLVRLADLVVCAGYDPIEMRAGWREVWDPDEKRVIDVSAAANTHYMHQAGLNFVCHVGSGLDAISSSVAPRERRAWLDGAVARTVATLAEA